MAGFPRSKDGAFVHLVLGLGEYADGGPAPIRIRPEGVGHDDLLGLGGELSILVEVDALYEQGRVERDCSVGITSKSAAVGLEEEGA